MGTASNSVLEERGSSSPVKEEAWASFSGAITMEGALKPQRHLDLEGRGRIPAVFTQVPQEEAWATFPRAITMEGADCRGILI